jgi:hypothetical protein
MHGLSRRVALECDQLEGRDCPAVLVFGGIMAVFGTAGADTVAITDDGAGNLTVNLNGEERTASGIQAVTVLTFGGSDDISYTLEGDQTGRRGVLIDAGSGDDLVALEAGAIGGQFVFAARGSSGADTLTATVGGVAEGAVAAIGLDGGFGDDTVVASAAGEYDGDFGLALSGGFGNDTITAGVDVAPDSTGRVAAVALGGFGDDNLTLNVTGDGVEELAELIAVINGGPGTDTGESTDNVTQISIELP